MLPNNYFLFTNGVCGTSTQLVSTASWLAKVVRGSYQVAVSSGSCVGAFQFQCSNDYNQGYIGNPGQFAPTNWNSIGSTMTIICSTTATAKVFLTPTSEMCFEYGRLVFIDASGGSAQGVFSARFKGDGL